MSMTPYLTDVQSPQHNGTPIQLADHSSVEATHQGTLSLPLKVPAKVPTLVFPSLHEPLLAISGICNKDFAVVFTKEDCQIFDASTINQSGHEVGQGYRKGNLYYLPAGEVSSNQTVALPKLQVDNSLLAIHNRLSHIGVRPLKRLLKHLNIRPAILNEINVQKCPICVQFKLHRRPLKSLSAYRSSTPGQLIHSNVALYKKVSREGYKYYVTFINDCSKFVSVYPMKFKSQVFSCFKLFRAFFEKTGAHKILDLRSNNGGEYISNKFTTYLAQAGISHKPGPPHSPKLNRVAERTNQTIGNLVRCSLLSANVPKSFWVDSLCHIVFSFNSIPCQLH
jgi:transposase InsO family protein